LDFDVVRRINWRRGKKKREVNDDGGKESPCAGIWRPRDYLIEKLAAGGVQWAWTGEGGKKWRRFEIRFWGFAEIWG
jgi:hypothetical protein